MSTDDCTDCIKAGEELDAFVRGELPIEQAERMSRHLDQCGHCSNVARYEKAFLERLRRACGAGERSPCPEALRQRITAALQRDQQQS